MRTKHGVVTRLFAATTVAALTGGTSVAMAQRDAMPNDPKPVVATKIDAAKEKSIRELLAVTGEAKQRAANIEGEMIAYFTRAAPNVTPADAVKMKAQLTDFSIITEALVRAYDKNYTQADIDALIAFYKTPTGQKYVKQLAAVQTEAKIGEQAWGNAKAQLIVAYLQARPDPSRPKSSPTDPAKPVKAFDKKPFVGNNKPVATKSGLKYEDMTVGTGAVATPGKTCVMHYTGTLTDGTKFDSSRDRGEAFDFPLGAERVIKGWDEGVAGMKVGGRRKLTIPYQLGYGEAGSPPSIPPKATLVFDVELMDVR